MLLVPEHASPVKNVGGPTTTDSDNQKWDDVTMCTQKICVHVIHYIALLHIVTLFACIYINHIIYITYITYMYILSIYNYVHILPKMSTRIRKTQGAFQDPWRGTPCWIATSLPGDDSELSSLDWGFPLWFFFAWFQGGHDVRSLSFAQNQCWW